MISKDMVLPVEVFVGGGGDIVILQEWPNTKGEEYLRVFINPDDAEKVCQQIMSAAKETRRR